MKRDLVLATIIPPMQFPNIVAFVEGTMEQVFLNNNFHYVQVVQVSNGVGWSVRALCQQIVTFYIARNTLADAVVVWVDRERRSETAEFIEAAIREALIGAGAPPDRLHILVCDMMTENIILSDEEYIRTKFGIENYLYSFEGTGGKSRLKALFKETGTSYRETTHGVAALKAVRLNNCQGRSPSVDRFLLTFQLPCWWTGLT